MMDKDELIAYLKQEGFPGKIIYALEKVRREDFVPDYIQELAYEDAALPLEAGATISQPYTICFMLNLLELEEGQIVLEIGSGSGYVLAVISELTNGPTYGVEIIKSLSDKSIKTLSNYKKIQVFNKDGSLGLQEKAPFDRIIISAEARKIPEHLYNQLNDNGIIVVPVKNSIFKITKRNNEINIKEYPGFIFVPLRSD
jgi:protein-L-isoaspartate(D-aspartate) O-methyltransferase